MWSPLLQRDNWANERSAPGTRRLWGARRGLARGGEAEWGGFRRLVPEGRNAGERLFLWPGGCGSSN